MAGAAALDGIVMVRDAYNLDPGVPFKFNKAIDLATGFRTRAVLSIGMRSSQRELLGVLQLINPRSEEDEAIEFSSEDQKLAVHFGGMASLAIERSSMTRALVLRMMRLAELRDPKETGAHVKRVAEVAVRLFVAWAQKRGMSEESIFKQLDHLRPAAMLHDVGKVGIEDAILKKPGKLEPEERARMEQHSRIGAETLLGVKTAMDETIREVTLYHHARWDGAGYPKREEIVQTLQQLGVDATDVPEPRGDGIPLPARLVAIADVFDALMSRRAYKDAWTPDQVRAEMVRSKGTHFDPELVDLFLADFEEYCLIHSTIRE
jgi:HD-GYP domain-containing protein (c-di-GMP phosphodiesterase class II)